MVTNTEQIIRFVIGLFLYVLFNFIWIGWSWLIIRLGLAYWRAKGRIPYTEGFKLKYFMPKHLQSKVLDESPRNYPQQILFALACFIFGGLGIFTYFTQFLPLSIKNIIELLLPIL
jgi:hypothetical protein